VDAAAERVLDLADERIATEGTARMGLRRSASQIGASCRILLSVMRQSLALNACRQTVRFR